VTLLVVATLGVLAAVAIVDALRSSPAPSVAATVLPTKTSRNMPAPPTVFAFGTRKAAIEEIGNTWAPLYAAGDPKACGFMGEGLCERESLPRFRASFAGATVLDIRFLNGHDARATFSNGVVVEFWGDGGTWTVLEVPALFNGG
jgi:hypothetical protein